MSSLTGCASFDLRNTILALIPGRDMERIRG